MYNILCQLSHVSLRKYEVSVSASEFNLLMLLESRAKMSKRHNTVAK